MMVPTLTRVTEPMLAKRKGWQVPLIPALAVLYLAVPYPAGGNLGLALALAGAFALAAAFLLANTVEALLGSFQMVRLTSGGNVLGEPWPVFSFACGGDVDHPQPVERELRASDIRYRELFEKNPQPMWVCDDRTLRFLAVNLAAVRHYGFSEQEFLQLRAPDILVENQPGTTSSTGEMLHRKKDGTIFPAEVTRYPLVFDQLPATLVVSLDLTQRKAAERKAAAFSDLARRLSRARTPVEAARFLMQTADALLGWDACTFDLCSPGQVELRTVYYVDTINGRRVDVSGQCTGTDASPTAANALAHGAQLILRTAGQLPVPALPFGDSARPSASLMFAPVRKNSEAIGVLSLQSYKANAYNTEDLDTLQQLADLCSGALERIRAEQEILRLNTDLERRVRERTAQLEAINRELEAFSYSVSHDLRAPLRSIRGFSEVLLERYANKLDDRGREFLARSCESSRQMDVLIEDLLKLSRVGRTQMQVQDVNLSALAQSVASTLQKHEPDRTVELIIAPDMTARGDERLLRIALDNLLANAWKFTSRQPHARIEFGRSNGDESPFFVRDNGAGFDMAYSSKLFGVFQRLHTVSEFPGTGIGLATVQRIINRHGGRTWAIGAVNEGATVYFTLPENGGFSP
jgi:PAS domain S-box-containing protein